MPQAIQTRRRPLRLNTPAEHYKWLVAGTVLLAGATQKVLVRETCAHWRALHAQSAMWRRPYNKVLTLGQRSTEVLIITERALVEQREQTLWCTVVPACQCQPHVPQKHRTRFAT